MIINYLRKAIDLPSIKVVSFDFFDTLVWRKFQKPVDLFLELGNCLIKDNLLLSPRTANAFALLRIGVESHARQQQKRSQGITEVTLEQIYAAFPADTFAAPLNEIRERELELEREFMVADRRLVETLQSVNAKDKIFVICSDTYFSEQELRSFMEKTGIPNDLFSKIFVSSAYQISKSEGLLAKVLSTCEILPEQLLHIGDHFYKDGDSAKMVGSIYLPYPEIGDHGNYAEKRFQRMAVLGSQTKPFLESEGGILGLSRRFKSLVADYPSDAVEIELAAYTYGPLFCGFAEWIGTEVTKFSPDLIFCPTREGLFLSRFLNEFFRLVGIDHQAHHFFTSRAALSQGKFFTGDSAEITQFFFSRRLPLTVRKFASIFNLDLETFSLSEVHLDYPIRSKCQISQEILMQIVTNAEIKSALLHQSAKARDRLLAYFENQVQEKLDHPASDGLKILVADVGWSGSSQKILASILKTRYPTLKLRGRYLLLESGALKNALAGADLEGWLLSLGETADFGNTIIPVKELLEQVLMADMPSTVDYTEAGNPVFFQGKSATPIFQKIQIKRLQELILSFLHHYWEFRSDVDLLGKESFFRTQLAAQAYDPEPKELELFKRWEHEDNDVAFVHEPIINDIQKHIFQHATLREIFRTASYWHLGNLKASYRELKERFFLQQFLGEYGLQDVYKETKIDYRLVSLEGETLDRVEARVEITDKNTGIIVCHCFTETSIGVVYTNTSGMDIILEQVVIEFYDTKNYLVDFSLVEPAHESLRITSPDSSEVQQRRWLPGWNLDLNLASFLPASSYDLTIILCARFL